MLTSKDLTSLNRMPFTIHLIRHIKSYITLHLKKHFMISFKRLISFCHSVSSALFFVIPTLLSLSLLSRIKYAINFSRNPDVFKYLIYADRNRAVELYITPGWTLHLLVIFKILIKIKRGAFCPPWVLTPRLVMEHEEIPKCRICWILGIRS